MAGKRRRARESGNPSAKTRSDKDERTTLADMTAEARAGFESRVASNPKGVYGVHRYEPSTYGLDPDAIHERFAFYTDRYDVPLES